MLKFQVPSSNGWGSGKQTSIGASIRIGQEIRCLPYAGFFAVCYKKKLEIFLDKNLGQLRPHFMMICQQLWHPISDQ